jgi:hypothetical protein
MVDVEFEEVDFYSGMRLGWNIHSILFCMSFDIYYFVIFVASFGDIIR